MKTTHTALRLASLVAASTLAACASSDPDASSSTSSTSSSTAALTDVGSPKWYPNGPYGFGVGNTIPNLSFQGKPGAASGKTDLSLRTISLSDYARFGTTQTKVLVITACATWCVPCRAEQPALVQMWQHYEQTHPGDVVFVNAMLQDGSFRAANEKALDSWSQEFGVPYDLVLDPTASTLEHMDPLEQETFPTTLVIRTRNMRITGRYQGISQELVPAIEAILAAPNDPNAPPRAPVGTIYPGPTPPNTSPDCSAPTACAAPAPSFTCPDGSAGTSTCLSAPNDACAWKPNPCPQPPPSGPCSLAECGGSDLGMSVNCDDGTVAPLTCLRSPDGTCAWTDVCGPVPPPSSDCSAPGTCGPAWSPVTCSDGSPGAVTCEGTPNGTCGYVVRCSAPPPPMDCSAAGACFGPPPSVHCWDGSVAVSDCVDTGGFCGWWPHCPVPDCTGQCAGPAPNVDTVCGAGLTGTAQCAAVSTSPGVPYAFVSTTNPGYSCEWQVSCFGGGGK